MSDPFNRRRFGRLATAAGLSTWLGTQVASTSPAASTERSPKAPFRRCVTLWMGGGPSQMDTFDPKPGSENGGPLTAVSTSVPGMQFCETFSGLAAKADEVCVLRSVGSTQGEHERASHLLHTGFERVPSFPRPSFGSFVADRFVASELPSFVTLGNLVYGPAFLGTANGPFVINNLQQTRRTIERVSQRSGRLDLISELNGQFQTRFDQPRLNDRSEQIESVRRMVDSEFSSALNLDKESESTRDRYGDSEFGRRVLVARRLLEAGARYVEVQLGGWDTHVGNFPSVRRLCRQVEPAWLALMEDLKSNGLWDDTLILWMGEFGRTPRINGQNGRDHYPQNIPVVMAGHAFSGQVIGSTGADGRDHEGQPSSVGDLMYTLMSLLGVDPDKELTTSFGSPTTATDEGSLIAGVLG